MSRLCLTLAAAMAASPAWSQSATTPSFGADAPWAQAYASCANAALQRHVAAVGEPAPWPGALVEMAEHDCVGEVPASTDSPLGVRATVSLVRSNLLHRFLPGKTLALGPPTPLRLPELFPAGDGVDCPHPEYPPAALRTQTSGASVVEIALDANGQVVDGKVASPSGPTREHRLLDRAALEAFALCNFKHLATPGTRPIRMTYAWRIE